MPAVNYINKEKMPYFSMIFFKGAKIATICKVRIIPVWYKRKIC